MTELERPDVMIGPTTRSVPEPFSQLGGGGGAGVPAGQATDPKRMTAKDLKRRFRLDEFLAEKLITAVAFVSLATIAMIFLFVFR